MTELLDGWRLAAGTLTAIRVAPPCEVNPRVARRAMLLAPVATLPLALLPLAAHAAIRWTGMPPLLAAALTVAGLGMASRALHLDGLADTVDGLTASYDRAKALAVMRTGGVGPGGVAALVLVLVIQIVALAELLGDAGWGGPVLAAVAVAASRHTLAWLCSPRFPAARADGLGAAVGGSVPTGAAAVVALLLAAVGAAAVWGLTPAASPSSPHWYAAALAVAAAVAAALVLGHRARGRLGGITGDVLGAGVEIGLAAALTVAALG